MCSALLGMGRVAEDGQGAPREHGAWEGPPTRAGPGPWRGPGAPGRLSPPGNVRARMDPGPAKTRGEGPVRRTRCRGATGHREGGSGGRTRGRQRPCARPAPDGSRVPCWGPGALWAGMGGPERGLRAAASKASQDNALESRIQTPLYTGGKRGPEGDPQPPVHGSEWGQIWACTPSCTRTERTPPGQAAAAAQVRKCKKLVP